MRCETLDVVGIAERPCNGEAVQHLVWHDEVHGPGGWLLSLVCAHHSNRIRAQWPPAYVHEPQSECAHPDAIFDVASNRCVLPDPTLVDEVESFLRHPTNMEAPC